MDGPAGRRCRPRAAQLSSALIDEDFWLMDDATVVRMGYQAGRFIGAEELPAAVLPRYRAARDAAWQAAIPFDEYWDTHRQYWRDRHAAAGRS